MRGFHITWRVCALLFCLVLCLASCGQRRSEAPEGALPGSAAPTDAVDTPTDAVDTPTDAVDAPAGAADAVAEASAEVPFADTSSAPGGVLVAYFSATGHTRALAEQIGEITGGTLYEIVPAEPYSTDDLKYYTDCRADREQNDPSCRPEIAGAPVPMADYDTIFLGYPIWHGQAPKILYSFLESYALSGVTIVPFCTSGSSPVGSSAENLHGSAPDADWRAGTRLETDATRQALQEWVDGLAILSR